jgi:hypothetical protein
MSQPVPAEGELSGKVPSAPHFFRLIKRSFLITAAALLGLALVLPAPLQGPADPGRVPNPVKSAWFLLWTQELVSWSKEWVYLLIALLALFVLLPWLPGTRPANRARWFPRDQWPATVLALVAFLGIVGLTIVAAFFRGQNWAFVSP